MEELLNNYSMLCLCNTNSFEIIKKKKEEKKKSFIFLSFFKKKEEEEEEEGRKEGGINYKGNAIYLYLK